MALPVTHERAQQHRVDAWSPAIAYEIHDGLLQYIHAALMQLQSYSSRQCPSGGRAEGELYACETLLRDAIQEGQALVQGLTPSRKGGLVKSIESLVRKYRTHNGPSIELVVDGGPIVLSASHHLAVFRVVHEAISNALRHSGSPRIRIEISSCGEHAEILVRDWGCGFAVDGDFSGLGLPGIHRRARLLGADLALASSPEEGTSVRLRFPLGGMASS
jgi:signal transduction histidine kinase